MFKRISLIKSYIYQYCIAIGSNLGDKETHIDHAIALISQQIGPIQRVASFFCNRPIGGVADLPFFNTAIVVKANIAPQETLDILLSIESLMGRTRLRRWENRVIDLDILLAKKHHKPLIWQSPTLTIPHPRMLERDFALVPAAEIAGTWIHPISLQSLRDEVACRKFDLHLHLHLKDRVLTTKTGSPSLV